LAGLFKELFMILTLNVEHEQRCRFNEELPALNDHFDDHLGVGVNLRSFTRGDVRMPFLWLEVQATESEASQMHDFDLSLERLLRAIYNDTKILEVVRRQFFVKKDGFEMLVLQRRLIILRSNKDISVTLKHPEPRQEAVGQ
jgi:hypothetical protein